MAINYSPPTEEKSNTIIIDGIAYGSFIQKSGPEEMRQGIFVGIKEKDGERYAAEALPLYIHTNPAVYIMSLQKVIPLEDYGFEGQVIPVDTDVHVSQMTKEQMSIFAESGYSFLPVVKNAEITQSVGLVQNLNTGEYSLDRIHIEEDVDTLIFWAALPPLSMIGDLKFTCEATNITAPFGAYRNWPIWVTDSNITGSSFDIVISGVIENITGLKDGKITLFNTEMGLNDENISVEKRVVDNTSFADENVIFSIDEQENIYKKNYTDSFDFVKGINYKVIWNGVPYEVPCLVADNKYTTYLGNSSLLPKTPTTEQPDEGETGSQVENPEETIIGAEFPFCLYNLYTSISTSTTYTFEGSVVATLQEGPHSFSFSTKEEEYLATMEFLPELVKKTEKRLGWTSPGSDLSFSLKVPFSSMNNYQNTFLYITPNSEEENSQARIKVRAMTYIANSGTGSEGDSGSTPCLAEDTLITMADGTFKQMSEIQVGDVVLSKDSVPSKIYAIRNQPGQECHTLYTFENGTVIDETGPHAFYCQERNYYLMLDQWHIGDHALDISGNPIALTKIERIEEPKQRYGIWAEEGSYYANGLLSGQVVLNTENMEDMSVNEFIDLFISLDQDKLSTGISI